MDLSKHNIEVIEIDVTNYIIDTFSKCRYTRNVNQFTFELIDSSNPSVPSNLINYYITGNVSGSYISDLDIEFYHDLTYSKGKSLEPVKFSYQIEVIEETILDYL